MKSLFIFTFTICFTGLVAAQTPAVNPPTATVPPAQPAQLAPQPANIVPIETKQQKLDTLWKLYEQTYGIAAASIKGYKLKSPAWEIEKLNDPQVYEKAVAEIGRGFTARVSEIFTEAELDYLIKLYASPLAKKMAQLGNDFWKSTITSPLISEAINSSIKQPTAAPKPVQPGKLPPAQPAPKK